MGVEAWGTTNEGLALIMFGSPVSRGMEAVCEAGLVENGGRRKGLIEFAKSGFSCRPAFQQWHGHFGNAPAHPSCTAP